MFSINKKINGINLKIKKDLKNIFIKIRALFLS
jgi:hypothetical protein